MPSSLNDCSAIGHSRRHWLGDPTGYQRKRSIRSYQASHLMSAVPVDFRLRYQRVSSNLAFLLIGDSRYDMIDAIDTTSLSSLLRAIILSQFGFVLVSGQPSTSSPNPSTETTSSSTTSPPSESIPLPSRPGTSRPRIPMNATSGGEPTIARPSFSPVAASIMPFLSGKPSLLNSAIPRSSSEPSQTPSHYMSSPPSVEASQYPSYEPSTSSRPSYMPSQVQPTAEPSTTPSSFPTYTFTQIEASSYRSAMEVPFSQTFFNQTETSLMMALFQSYTKNIAPVPGAPIHTNCTYTRQARTPGNMPNISIIECDYRCVWSSNTTSVTNFTGFYVAWYNANTVNVTRDLILIGVNLLYASGVIPYSQETFAPTSSLAPSVFPSLIPTHSNSPSLFPSDIPTWMPSEEFNPTMDPTTRYPTSRPSMMPSQSPSMMPRSSHGLETAAIAGIVLGAGLAGLLGLFLFYWYWINKRRERVQRQRIELPDNGEPAEVGAAAVEVGESAVTAAIQPSESLASNKSLLSAGDSVLLEGADSADELDGTKNLQDEFDQYKDQNLEQLRANVEGHLPGFEGIMSAAVTKALMDNDQHTSVDPRELYWGGSAPADSGEIEASVLCEVNDWMKPNENCAPERKHTFMQEILNKMVASVRSGVINADDASRTIHECAALLGLPLEHALPMTTLIVSGMRKAVSQPQMHKAFKEFGDVDSAAVASGQRGFGFVRFRSLKTAERVFRRYKIGEVVVQDVAVQIKILRPDGSVEG